MGQHNLPMRRSKAPRVDTHVRIGASDWARVQAFHARRLDAEDDPGYSVQDTLRKLIHYGLLYVMEHDA